MSFWLRRVARLVGLEEGEPSYWERFASKPLKADASSEDLLRWAVLGKLDRVRPGLLAYADELRASVGMGGVPNIHLHARALALDWLVRGVFDHTAAIKLASANPSDDDDPWQEIDWFNVLRPNAETAARFAGWGERVQREKKRGARGDGNTQEVIYRNVERFNLVSSLRFGDTLCDGAEGAAAFERYLSATLDFYEVVDAVLAITVRAALFAPNTAPQIALRWLKVT
jgi:hypothetical protein